VLTGELDMAAAFKLEPETDRLLSQPGIRTLRMDLAGISFIDSTGLGALLSIRDRAVQLGIDPQITCASEAVQRLLDATGTRSLFGA
jgi:anti-sigma B factor antagonist